jgi:hypothetical protein
MRHAYLELARRELAQHGITPTVSRTNGDHLRIEWHASGVRQVVIVSSTPGDRRTAVMARSDVRRLLRKIGL